MRINTNISALAAQRAMTEHSRKVENATGKISSGTRVRSAADDAASLSIGTQHKTQARSAHQAIRNANDAISEMQTADGAMNEVGQILTRLRELSIQAANGSLQDNQRLMLNEEYMQLRHEIERIAEGTKFQGGHLLRGTEEREFMVGTRLDDNAILSSDRKDFIVTEFSLGLVDSSIINFDEARLNLQYIDKAIEKLAERRAKVGAFQNRLTAAASNLEVHHQNETESASTRLDADYAFETAERIKNTIKHDAASSVLAQTKDFSALTLNLFKTGKA